jgi:ADP-ribosylglycohydrolase/protein-tyrosine phosphatase
MNETMKTSLTDPLRIAVVSPPSLPGVIGLTLCPGKKDPNRGWNRDLDVDFAVIREWGAEVVITLLERHELEFLDVTAMPDVAARLGLKWLHLPIRDVWVPDAQFEALWLTAGRELRKVLRRGVSLLIHCRGGVGRSGMIAARLLVELGMDAQAAIDAVRHARPGAIETREQELHVRGCRRIIDDPDEVEMTDDPITDRALGCLFGLAVGDAIGTTLEFTGRDQRPPLTDMVGGGPFRLQPGEWTDDTSMALCLADGLLARGELDQLDLIQRFVRWWKDGENSCNGRCFDIGITTRTALSRFLRTGDPKSGSEPIERGARYRPRGGDFQGFEGTISEFVAQHVPLALQSERSLVSWCDSWYSGAYLLETVPCVLLTLARYGHDPETAIIRAVNDTRDNDTMGAIVGAAVGAVHGAKALPVRWREGLVGRTGVADDGRVYALLEGAVERFV